MKHTLATLAFYATHGKLHSFDKTNKQTRRAVKTLERLGYLKVSWATSQAEHTGKVFV